MDALEDVSSMLMHSTSTVGLLGMSRRRNFSRGRHGLGRVFQLRQVPISGTNQARERHLRLGKRFASLTFTVLDKSVAEMLGHDTYMKFLGRRTRHSEVLLWHCEGRGLSWRSLWRVPPPS